MVIITTKKQLTKFLIESKLNPINKFNSTWGYKDSLVHSCGCWEKEHKVNDRDTKMVLSGVPVKFLLLCANDYLTCIRVKGIFKLKVENYWTCDAKLYDEIN